MDGICLVVSHPARIQIIYLNSISYSSTVLKNVNTFFNIIEYYFDFSFKTLEIYKYFVNFFNMR